MIEVLKQAYQLLLTEPHAPAVCDQLEVILRQAIKEWESQEPVELTCCGYTDASAIKWNSFNGVVQCHNCGQTYTPPQRTWVGLTPEEILDVFDAKNVYGSKWLEFARAVEAKLKEKNT